MQFVNYYSGLIAAGLLLAVGVARVVRRGGKLRDWLILSGVLAVGVGVWFYLRPVASGLVDASGRPVLLEVQSPYCLGCVAVKPAVDRLENELREKRRRHLNPVLRHELPAFDTLNIHAPHDEFAAPLIL